MHMYVKSFGAITRIVQLHVYNYMLKVYMYMYILYTHVMYLCMTILHCAMHTHILMLYYKSVYLPALDSLGCLLQPRPLLSA